MRKLMAVKWFCVKNKCPKVRGRGDRLGERVDLSIPQLHFLVKKMGGDGKCREKFENFA